MHNISLETPLSRSIVRNYLEQRGLLLQSRDSMERDRYGDKIEAKQERDKYRKTMEEYQEKKERESTTKRDDKGNRRNTEEVK